MSSDFLSQSESEGCHNSTVDGLQFGDHDYFKQLDRQKRSHVSHNTETDDWNSDSEWVNSELLLSDSSKQQECNRVDKASEDDEYTPQERERPHVNRSGSNLSSKKYKRKHRCGECTGCLASDCIDCRFCLDMIKYGGTGKLRQACMNRKCLAVSELSVLYEYRVTHSGNVRNSAQPKDRPLGGLWKLFSFTAHGLLIRIKIVVLDSMSAPKVGRYSKAVLVTCVTILQYMYRFGN